MRNLICIFIYNSEWSKSCLQGALSSLMLWEFALLEFNKNQHSSIRATGKYNFAFGRSNWKHFRQVETENHNAEGSIFCVQEVYASSVWVNYHHFLIQDFWRVIFLWKHVPKKFQTPPKVSSSEQKNKLGATEPVDGLVYLILGIGLTSCENDWTEL